jgi:hypothetical protein
MGERNIRILKYQINWKSYSLSTWKLHMQRNTTGLNFTAWGGGINKLETNDLDLSSLYFRMVNNNISFGLWKHNVNLLFANNLFTQCFHKTKGEDIYIYIYENQAKLVKLYCWQIARSSYLLTNHSHYVCPCICNASWCNNIKNITVWFRVRNCTNYECQMYY